MIRSIYRVVEYVQGQGGDLQSREFWLYIFDALPMVVVALLMNWMHPSKVISRRTPIESSYALEDGLDDTGLQSEYK